MGLQAWYGAYFCFSFSELGTMSDPCPLSADSVSVIDSCPMTSSEWNQRALMKNCSMYPDTCTKPLEYHCLLNPYANESLEVCAPNTWLDKGKYNGSR